MRLLRAGLAAAALALAPLAAQAESLADALVQAYRHAALLEQNRAVLRAADEDVAIAMAALRPVLEWSLKHQFTSVDGYESQSQTLAIQGSMMLYDFGRSELAIDAAKETVLATRARLKAVEQDVLLTAISAYLNVRSAEQQLGLQRNSVRVVGEELKAAQDRFDVGEITVTDVSLARAQLAQSRAQEASAQGQLDVAREEYKAAIGKAPGDLSQPPKLPKLPKSAKEAQAAAQRNHPAIEEAQRNVAAAELQVAAAAAERRPKVEATFGVQAQRADNRFTGDSEITPSGAVNLQMSQTIYSGGRLSAGHRKAMAGRDARRSGLLNVAQQVDKAVGTAWANIDVARAQIKAIDQQISAAQQAYEGVREEATLGARTTLDVLDSEQSLLTARANRITAEANLQLAHYQLLAAMGLLTVENLKLGIPTYDPSAYYNAVHDAPYTSTQGRNLERVLRAIGKGN